ncbi:GbsR/MarR family transcriptional regulator [Ostreibacterium oceani]|uniref:HTH-type transcriptional regulator n=1 Tax=Ostreibacterium oceani TaxID=2654998 RepID=A0A6N7EX28_9GAMM|nr:GbsR/MarR family transcriptional regulator [Ostreibacterium oceani]MPV85687.1 ArsR family transcriptional regulator [Ostreibacterium oceani]
MNLPPLIQNFVIHFGEMGSRWGINRTVGQIYALLYLSDQPMHADEIVEQLGFSRSNVAMSLKELMGMNLVLRQHLPEDRKDYYATHDDVWDIVRNLLEERRKREIDPTLTMLRSVIMETPASETEKQAQEKMKAMHDMIEMLTDWHAEMQKMETEKLINLLKMGAKIYQVYLLKDKVNPFAKKKDKAVIETPPNNPSE